MTLNVRSQQLQQMADAEPGKQNIAPCDDTKAWIEFRLQDKDGDPIPGERFTVRLPDESLHEGRLDREGKVRFDGIIPGTAKISFPGIDAKEWRPL